MKLFKKSEHCLFVEEETYDWAPERHGVSKALIAVAILASLLVLAVLLL